MSILSLVAILVEIRDHRTQFCKGAIQESFQQSLNYRTEFHETWWSYRYMFLVDHKVFRFVVNGVKAIFLGVTIESYGKLENFVWET
jgi:hypothetical protein